MRASLTAVQWPSAPLAVALGLAAGLGLVGLAHFAGSDPGRLLDEHLLSVLNQQRGNGTLLSFGDDVNNGALEIVAVWDLVLVITTLTRARDPLSAVAVVVLPAGAVAVSQALKNSVVVHHDRLGASLPVSLSHTWPSTHAAALAALALGTVVVRPTRRSALAAAAFLVIFSLCLCFTAAHFPSDVLGGWLVALGVLAVVSVPVRLLAAIL